MKISPHYDGPSVLSFDGPLDDHAVVVARQRRRMEAVLAGLSDEQWHAPSRCAGWDARDVVAHLVGVNAFWEASVRAGLAGTPTRVLASFDPAAHPPLLIEPMRGLAPSEVLEQFVAGNDGFLDALASIDASGWAILAESPVGHVPIRLLAAHALWDAWVHERDIVIALRLEPTEEPDEVVACLRYAAAIGAALAAGDDAPFAGTVAVAAVEPDVAFTVDVGASVTVRDGAASAGTPCLRGSAVHLTEAFSLRAPLPTDTPDAWRRVVGGLATVFDADLQAGR